MLLKSNSVELSVDEWASEEEIAKMTDVEKKQVWEKAKKEMERKVRHETGSIITLQLRSKSIQIKFVERGKERFIWGDAEEGDTFIGGVY